MNSKRASLSVDQLKLRYAAWMALMPLGVFAATFVLLCLYECAASPWATFLIAPVLSILIGVTLMSSYLNRASELDKEPGRQLRSFVLWSPLWGSMLAGATFFGLLQLFSMIMMIMDRLALTGHR